MSTVLRRNRKGSDEQIIRMNAIGLSLASIAMAVQCHPTSITLRLKSLNIPAADTRRAFMEDIYSSLPTNFKDNLADFLTLNNKPLSVKDYVRNLIVADVEARLRVAELGDQPDEPVLSDIVVPTEGFNPTNV
jgi:hypothetical protein